MYKQFRLKYLLLPILILLFFTACSTANETAEMEPTQESEAEEINSEEEESLPNEQANLDLIEDDTIAVEFVTSDGRTLSGIYYPAAVNPAPLVILMHWAPGDQSDMAALAYWLQNRGLAATMEIDSSGKPWLNPSWFPEMETDRTYAVFTFTFDGCEGGCSSFDRENWLLDAQAAVETAYGLEGIDQNRIATIGASIGADGAADGCLYLNNLHTDACQGAFSLSPGDYLTLPYQDVVDELSNMSPAVTTECLYAENDTESAVACQAVPESDTYKAEMYAGNSHGLMLIQPGLEPDPLSLLLDFLTVTID